MNSENSRKIHCILGLQVTFRLIAIFVGFGVLLTGISAPAFSETLLWDIDDTIGSGVNLGDGNWDTSIKNWTADFGTSNKSFSNGDDVIFGNLGGATATVTINGTVKPTSIIIVGDGYTFTGGTIGSGEGVSSILSFDGGGTAIVNSGLDGDFALTGSTTLTYTGAFGTIDDMTVDIGSHLILGTNGTISNTLTNNGTVTGTVTNEASGIVTSTGTLEALINSGTANLSGTITGDLNQLAGTLTFTGNLTVGGDFVAETDLTIGSGRIVTAGLFQNTTGVTLDLNGRLNGIVENFGTIEVGDGAVFGGSVTNTGNITADADTNRLTFEGNLTNSGVIDMTQNASVNQGDPPLPHDIVQINGNLIGSTDSVFKLDINLSGVDSTTLVADTADIVTVTGTISGPVELKFTNVGVGFGNVTSIAVLRFVSKAADFQLTTTGLAVDDYVYATRENDISVLGVFLYKEITVISAITPGIAALGGSVALTQSLIGTIVNRPSSPFVIGLAFDEPEKQCGVGGWGRMIGGRADASGTSADEKSQFDSSISATYAGIQFGSDMACFYGHYYGWDMAFGGFGGLNIGNTSQPVFAAEPVDPIGEAFTNSDILASTTATDFEQKYAGVYMTAGKGRFSADIQYRLERTDFELTNTPTPQFTALGFDGKDFKSDARTISGSMSYAIPLKKQGWSIVPTVGYADTQIETSAIIFDNGSTLQIEPSSIQVGFAGATVAKVSFGKSGNTALNRFVTVTYYNDFSPDTISTFTGGAVGSTPTELSASSLGSYQEVSVGLSFIKVLDKGRAKSARQFNASARLDGRVSDTLDSLGLTAQVRWQF